MKKAALVMAITLITVIACKKEEGTTNNTSTASGANLSFKLDGSPVSVTAKWKQITGPPSRWRITWEETGSGTYKNIEIDLYNSTPGSFKIKSSPSAMDEAGFQYYLQNGASALNYQGDTGTVTLASFTNNKMTGSFSGTVKESGVSHSITEGKFTDVPKQ